MKKISFILLCVLIIQSGCKKFSEFQVDPNKTTIATPDLLLNTIEQKAFQSASISAAFTDRQMINLDGVNLNQYYGWTRADFSPYNNLRQVLKMEQAAIAQNKPEYIPIAKFFRAWFFLQLTQTFGDVPYSQALAAEEGKYTPVYDKQEDIYLSILNDLKAANALITNNTASVLGDIVYNGNMQQWKQAINSLSLRVLMSMSLKVNDARYDIKNRFATIVNNPAQSPVFTSNADNTKLTFFDVEGTRYPYYNNNDIQTAYYMEETFVDMLKQLKDVRLFSFADKAPKFASLPATDFNAYGGGKGSADVDANKTRSVAGELSRINPRFYKNPINEPSIALGYAELQFILAEGALKGWISGNASTFYEEGIRASMLFYNIDQPTINTYLAQNGVKLSGSDAIQLKSIITQKYIASFMNSDYQPFYEHRRTGFPDFDVSGDGVLNNKMVPKRWMYPESELRVNQQHNTEAIARQYPQGDNINGVMWLIKP
jgi:hypothetical protein